MSKRIVVIEGVSPKGHVDFNKQILDYLNGSITDIFIGESLKSRYNTDKVKCFNDSFVFKGRLSHAVGFLMAIYRIFKTTKSSKINTYLLLSYDILSLPVIALYAKIAGINVIACEHNTVPTSLSKKFLQKLSSNVGRICFMPSVSKIYERLGCNVLLTKLPLPDLGKDIDMKVPMSNYIFCPSASSDEERIISEAAKNPELNFLLKSTKSYVLKNVVCKTFFDDYIGSISGALAVYIPMKNSHRVSGPLLDAVSLGKQVILPSGELYDFAVDNFPNNVIHESELSIDFKFKDVYVDVENYNHVIRTELNSFVLRLNDSQ